jgi:shikimate kinase
MTPRVVLVGLPGSGKTSTGRRLAKILAVPFADSDELVETATGRPVTALFAEVGEAGFRAAEQRAVAAALHDFDGVLALGGGAVGSPDTRAALMRSPAPVVQLRARLETLHGRVGSGQTRPLLTSDPQARLRELAAERAPLYDEVATFSVPTDGRTPGQVAATVAARLHELEVRR